jgi:hypothetical protein
MTPNEKGRFCQSCSKTVVDFTNMNVEEIQTYIHTYKSQRICGHIKQSQLDTINLKIPETVFNQNWNFHRLFLLALLLAMGTTLLNCSNNEGRLQNIDSVEIIDSLNYNNKIDLKSDSINCNAKIEDSTKIKSTQAVPLPPIVGEVIEITGIVVPPKQNDEVVFGLILVEHPPEFEYTPSGLSRSEKKKYFSQKVNKIVSDNFNIGQGHLHLSGKQRIYTQFKIDEKGFVKDIKVRSSSHSELEKEAIRVIKLLPKFKPAKQRGKNIGMVYTLPIVIMIED